MTLQADAQLVITDGSKQIKWTSKISGPKAKSDDINQRIVMQDDCNLVQWTSQNKPIFQTKTANGVIAPGNGRYLDYCGNL